MKNVRESDIYRDILLPHVGIPRVTGGRERVWSYEIFSRQEKSIVRFFFFQAESIRGKYEDNLGLRFQRVLSSIEPFSALRVTAVSYRIRMYMCVKIEHSIDSLNGNILRKFFRQSECTCLDIYWNYL